jgi:universal stress protein A
VSTEEAKEKAMFKKLLVPLDLTDKHQAVLATAAELAQQNGGDVTLLHVIEVIAGLSIEEDKGFFNRLERSADKHLQGYLKGLMKRQIPCQKKVLIGNRAREIVAFAAENGAELILLTAPRFDPSNPTASWGSLSYKVGLLSQCPVLLVKGSAQT